MSAKKDALIAADSYGNLGNTGTTESPKTNTITGASPKIININIQKVVGIESFKNEITSIKDDPDIIGKAVVDAILKGVSDVKIQV